MEKEELVKNYELLRRRKTVSLFKRGYRLEEICKETKSDVSTIIEILRTKKIRKTVLFRIYIKQSERESLQTNKAIIEREEHFLDKFFPISSPISFSNNYFLVWKERYKELEERRNKCDHHVRHIHCSLCNKVLRDASEIPLEEPIITSETEV